MVTDQRRNQLLELVRQRGFASLPDLTNALQVSASTIRRDLDYLVEIGEAKRTHGGVFYTGASPKLPHFEHRQQSNWQQKRAIARAAATMIQDGDTVLLDGGSTTYELARLLVGRSVQIVTNSLPVATLFSGADIDLILLGGYVHQRTGVCLGAYTNQMLQQLNVRRSIVSVAGITERGCFNSNLLLVETEQAMMKAADEVMVLADSTKFGHQSLALMCELGEVDKLVVDEGLSKTWRSRIKAVDIELTIAASEEPAPENGQ